MLGGVGKLGEEWGGDGGEVGRGLPEFCDGGR